MSRLTAALVLVLAFVAAACSPGSGPGPTASTDEPTAAMREVTLPSEDAVDLRVYFRHGQGPKAYLQPVTRSMTIADDLPRAALEQLIAGPQTDDGKDLRAPLPTTTRLLGLRMEGDTAHVDLSAEVITDAASVGAEPSHELLALAAIANTLTEFPAIDRIRLTVEGHDAGVHGGVDVGAFWGGWGVSTVLARDESVVGEPREGEGVPDLRAFSAEAQQHGSTASGPVRVTSVRTRDRVGYLRLVVELAGDDERASVGVPPVRAQAVDGRVVLEVDAVSAYEADVAPGQRIVVSDPSFEMVQVDQTDLPGTVRVAVVPVEPREFWLHTLTSPTRVVLDVRK